jgi:AraC family transcriptional regulator of adaptative response / DNA-3-methyladenine glycosylase II
MELDPARCYRAMLSRDRRFDGRIFGGVVTTGVYCRPICPVHPPKPENVRWFVCAAAAEAAGFRPCRRCRPETAPGTPAWLGTSAVVSRALRLIDAEPLEDCRVDALAGRLGLGARQLRRLFAQHLGASPAQIMRARRVHFARRLIDETNLPITQVGLAAGFSSVRQFNHAVRATFGQPPSALRRARSAATSHSAADANGALALRLPFRPPLDWDALTSFLALRATPGVECVDADVYRRTVEVNGIPGVIEIRPGGEAHLTLRVQLASYDGLFDVTERARRLCDLGADPLRIAAHLRRSRSLRPFVDARPGLRVPGAWDAFELAVRAVLGQQVSVRGATTLAGRLVGRFGRPVRLNGDGRLTHVFPRPEVLADADLSSIGLPQARATTIRRLAAAVAGGALRLDASLGLEDAVARMCAIPGIGAWTAQYIAMRAPGEPDAFPASDLGLCRAVGVTPAALAQLAEAWRPWRAYAAMHLWTAPREAGGHHDHRDRRDHVAHRQHHAGRA